MDRNRIERRGFLFSRWPTWITSAALVAFVGCPSPDSSANKGASANVESSDRLSDQSTSAGLGAPLDPQRQRIKTISDSETLVQSLTSEMRKVGRALTEPRFSLGDALRTPFKARGIEPVDWAELMKSPSASPNDLPGDVIRTVDLKIASTAVEVEFAELWPGLIPSVGLTDAQLGVLSSNFVSDDEFWMQCKFEGRLLGPGGEPCGLHGHHKMLWQRTPPGPGGTWQLAAWEQEDLAIDIAPQPLFVDVTTMAIPDPETYERVTTASHQKMILEFGRRNEQKFPVAREAFKSFSDWESAYQYPSVSVVDVDQDGLDDLFVTDRWSAAQLLRNTGNGTFEDITASSGLVVEELANCAYFVDFDNDGDSDVFVGRTLGPSKFFRNENGKFVPDEINNEIIAETRFVVSASVIDVNRDGLLDLYLCTYGYGTGAVEDWAFQTTRPQDRARTRLLLQRSHSYVDRRGPPNILLMNRGGKFEWTSIDDELKQFRNSYQSVWSDFDLDGDQDLYVCNDFSPDAFLRNDTERGSNTPKFVDVTSEISNSAAMGFGMGASWGDYDVDGDLDLYVSNMYSKAGNRIVAMFDDVDERIRVSAHGNYLFRNDGGKFEQVAGKGEGDQQVASVGWSFGGQFADFDNDGFLDLYVPSGFYSPPREINGDVDL